MKKRFVAGLLVLALCCAASSGMCMGKTDTAYSTVRSTIHNNIRLVRSFMQYFDNASNERWDTLGNNFLVKFTLNNKQGRALFTNKGNLIYSILVGTEKELPAGIRYQVRSNYFDYHIVRATEVYQNRCTAWIVELACDDKRLTLRLEDGEMEEVLGYTDN